MRALSDIHAVRLEQLSDLYAPMGKDGMRHPERGIISRKEFLELMDAPEMQTPEAADAEVAVGEYLTRCERP
jgi:hypothetical protein